jgi:hypothetical protein
LRLRESSIAAAAATWAPWRVLSTGHPRFLGRWADGLPPPPPHETRTDHKTRPTNHAQTRETCLQPGPRRQQRHTMHCNALTELATSPLRRSQCSVGSALHSLPGFRCPLVPAAPPPHPPRHRQPLAAGASPSDPGTVGTAGTARARPAAAAGRQQQHQAQRGETRRTTRSPIQSMCAFSFELLCT